MLKDYADELLSLDLWDQKNMNLFEDAESYLDDYPMFTSYSSARNWCKNHVVGRFIKAQNRVDLVSDNKVILFDGLYYVVPYLAKQEFLALLKKRFFEVTKK